MSGVDFVNSPDAMRIWQVNKAAGRPLPTFSDDDVIDYMVMEAIALKVAKKEKEEAKKREIEDWKKDKSSLNEHR